MKSLLENWNIGILSDAYVADIQEGDSKAQLWITVKSFIQ